MDKSAHIYHPKDNSLEARIDAYKEVYQAWLNAEASMKYLGDDEWADTLGDREEVEEALDVIIQSMKKASDSFTREEVGRAKNAGLLDEHQAMELIQGKLRDEMKSIRERYSQSSSSEHSQKR